MADQPEALRLADAIEAAMAERNKPTWGEIVKAATELRRLAGIEAERDALRVDAERYRWLREKNGVAVDVVVFGTTHGDLDAAIDAAKGGGNG